MTFDYEATYLNLYKKLPMINAIVAIALAIGWGILDCAVGITGIGDMGFVGFLTWLGIGVPFAAIVGLFTMLFISATIVRTDAVLEIKRSLKNDTQFKPDSPADAFHDLPEL